MWKSDLKMSKEKWVILLICGIILLILSFPIGKGGENKVVTGTASTGTESTGEVINGVAAAGAGSTAGDAERAYEKLMETRVKEILKNVEGVGTVEVMLTLKASKEKVIHVDKDKSRSSTEEKDSTGGTRKSMSEDIKESTFTAGGGTSGEPMIEKELQPEIAGIIISAEGGNSTFVKNEISQAMEALFDIPAHKIKVLKRVD
ncbi:MAG: stage III sporulation protein AG [Clostridium sp.]